nr:MAG TPA: 2-oxoglutarate dehydrogenase-like protein [Caudoviricetes sp.]
MKITHRGRKGAKFKRRPFSVKTEWSSFFS